MAWEPLGWLRRFRRAWWVAWRITVLNVRAQLEYRGDFLMVIASGIVWQMSILVFATVLLARFSGLGGWNSSQVLLIVGMRLFSHALYVLVFGRATNLTYLVQEGMVEVWLVRPMPAFRQAQLAHFPSNGIGDLIVGVSLFTAAVSRSAVHWTPGRIAFLFAGVIGGMLMEGAIGVTLASLTLHHPTASYWNMWVDELWQRLGAIR